MSNADMFYNILGKLLIKKDDNAKLLSLFLL